MFSSLRIVKPIGVKFHKM